MKGKPKKRVTGAGLILALLFFSLAPPGVYAVGEGNIDSGGGEMGSGSGESFWNPGNEGVRVSVVRADDHAVVNVFDVTNKQPVESIFHFGSTSKIQYNDGSALSSAQGGYSYYNPEQPLPRIIPTGSDGNNIEAIKSYFTDEQVIRSIAGAAGMDFDRLVNGEYKLVLEPVAYFKFQGADVAMTATEAALYDEVVDGALRVAMGTLTHKNLPLSMFLETSDMAYPAWAGSTSGAATNADILSSLGLGIVRFEEQPEPVAVSVYDYEYRVDTDVITSVWVSGGQADPDRPVTVTFDLPGGSRAVGGVYYPSGDSQLVWVKWRTPATPRELTIPVRVSGPGSARSSITARIVDLDKNPPPNPVADDRNDDFSPAPVPGRPQTLSASWGVWSPWWYAYWVWYSDVDEDGNDHGYWVDEGWWEFDHHRYSASLTGTMRITPDTHNPTAEGRVMKTGYGINETVTAVVSSSQSASVTAAQNAVSYFPEFRYETFWRLLDRSVSGNGSEFRFKPNPYSTYRNRTHFTPIWMPDGAYTVHTWLIDCWTPAGMLSMNLTDALTLRGTLWDDWHIAPLSP
ncbi:MAG: hypothetical protein LBL26_02045 [Peptococcaceae bacterium]|jgi:hypothetical protein|nr:hypothetical protein [Peptococcaceae bacterium]